MTTTAVALRHLAFEDLGTFAPVMEQHGYDLHYLDVGVDEISENAVCDADLLVVLGGPVGANDGDLYPVVDHTIRLLRKRLTMGLPTLGVCLGAQLMARALGATVAPGPAPEIGYGPLTLNAEGHASALRHLATVPVLHWHNDRFDIPVGAIPLASTEGCDNQAFSYGSHALALQFHIEVPRRDIERWLIGHAEALSAAARDPRTIREQALLDGDAMEKAAELVLSEWLTGIR